MSNRTAGTDKDGILTDIIALQTSQTYVNGGDSFTEKFKGPYSEMRKVQNGYVVAGTTISVGSPRPNFSGKFKFQYDPPEIKTGFQWIVKRINCEQQQAGDHAILTIDYEPIKWDTNFIVNPKSKSESWSVSW